MSFITIDGHNVVHAVVHVPNRGPWWIDVELEADPLLSGAADVRIGSVTLKGTIDPKQNGTRGLQRFLRVVAGGGGWSTPIEPKHYHNDSRIRARSIVEDAARAAGEILGEFAPENERVGIDYMRRSGPAVRALEDAIGDVLWWVGFDGLTNVGSRPAAVTGQYQVLNHEPAQHLVELAVDSIDDIEIGSTLSDGLDIAETVREMEFDVRPNTIRVKAWCGGVESTSGRLVALIKTIVNRCVDARIHSVFRYRVVRMSGDRVELQIVNAKPGLPDALPVSMFPGAAGIHSVLTPGSFVLVSFVDGDPTMPVITHFAGKDGTGFVPVSSTLDATTEIKLGAAASSYVALATLCNIEFGKISTTLGSVVDASFATPYTPASVAASKVKAQ